MNLSAKQENKQTILEGTYEFLVEHGLEKASIREICRHIGFVQGSLYYWYDNKEELVCEAMYYGILKLSKRFFYELPLVTHDLTVFCQSLLHFAENISKELRLLVQMAASPEYGKKIREKAPILQYAYDYHARKMAEKLKMNFTDVQPIVFLLIDIMTDYALWQNKRKALTQLHYIFRLMQKKNTNKSLS